MPFGPSSPVRTMHDIDVVVAAAGDERLGAVDDIVVAVAHRAASSAPPRPSPSRARSGSSCAISSIGDQARAGSAGAARRSPKRSIIQRAMLWIEMKAAVEGQPSTSASMISAASSRPSPSRRRPRAHRCRRSRAPRPSRIVVDGEDASRPTPPRAGVSARRRRPRPSSWMARWSSVRSKSMVPPPVGSGARSLRRAGVGSRGLAQAQAPKKFTSFGMTWSRRLVDQPVAGALDDRRPRRCRRPAGPARSGTRPTAFSPVSTSIGMVSLVLAKLREVLGVLLEGAEHLEAGAHARRAGHRRRRRSGGRPPETECVRVGGEVVPEVLEIDALAARRPARAASRRRSGSARGRAAARRSSSRRRRAGRRPSARCARPRPDTARHRRRRPSARCRGRRCRPRS